MRFLFSAFLFFVSLPAWPQEAANYTLIHGGFIRGDSTQKEIALLFTADEWAEGLPFIRQSLSQEGIKAGFFFTGQTFRNKTYRREMQQLATEGHYIGPHSDQHLLLCDWVRRDSLLVTRDSFERDIQRNIETMKSLGLPVNTPQLFVPPYEWWNDSIATWSKEEGLAVVSFTPGIRTNADYTWPEMGSAYKSTEWLVQWLKESVQVTPQQWAGALMLIHAGTDPRRQDKLYYRLPEIIRYLKQGGFRFRRIDALVGKGALR